MRRPLSGDGLLSTGFGDLKVFSGSAHPQLTREIADCLGIPLGRSHTVRFSNENLKVKIEEILGTALGSDRPTQTI